MGKITFILGGVRSGKSELAIKLAKANYKRVAFVATCLGLDNEMRRRISRHKKSRPNHWQTFENPKDLGLLLKRMGTKFEVIIIDCLTIWLSNLVLKGIKEKAITQKLKETGAVLKKIKAASIIVSNEVGLGIVPENKLAREFRDIAGRMNQIVAENSDAVFFMISGIPWRVK